MAASDKKFNVGIIGYGLSAKVFHIPFINLTPQFNLHSIVQRKPTASSSAPNDYPTLKHHTSLEPMLQDPEVDIVNILTPPNTHFSFAKQALQAGKHVLVEKPFVPTVAEAEELIQIAKTNNRLICVYQNRRWDSDFLTVKKMINDGILGRVYEFDTHFDRYRPDRPSSWKGELGMDEGGGALYDLGSHLIDQVYHLFGMPQGVYGKLVSQRDGRFDAQDPDSVHAQLTYPDGLIVSVRIGVMSVETIQPRFWIRGTRASFHKTALDPQEDQLKAGRKPDEPGFGVEDPINGGRLLLVRDGGRVEERTKLTVEPKTYLKLFEAFARAVETGRDEDVPVPASEARDVLRIIDAVRESAKTGSEIRLS
ncbi:putative oxidoreductase [Colletotrichum orbiculare MAFF 240422]|uniref:Oxidoreductase n=1 Tax=Colletotrichum orbiculare (strain 104-T / ATCC 96160 / CBS 514.97 / LARS 414 / MAFF 240422) TaxID=1213857 RepID=N4VN20_COLOR|nr:putative oxidoreductase [Colletotrichum orbiculare MAFF 240422]